MSCPTEQELTRHLKGELSVATDSELSAHLESCPSCKQRLAQISLGQTPRTSSDYSTVALSSQGSDTSYSGIRTDEEAYLQSFLAPPRDEKYLGSFDRYDIESDIGRGGMGIVFRAYDDSLRRRVAIKVLAPEVAANPIARERFRREAHAAAAISDHDSVVTIYAVGEFNKLPYLSMQFVQGCSLQEKLNSDGAIAESQVHHLGLQIAEALDFAHRNGLIHRDIKPSNILLDEEVRRARLADFGLARWVDDATITVSGTIVGTVAFMSPEQAQGAAADERSDLYSLGAVLYAAAVGRPPHQAESSLALLRKVCDEQPQDLDQLDAGFSQPFASLIRRLLTKDPAERIQSAQEVVQLLREEPRRSLSDWTRISADDHSAIVGASPQEPLSEFLGHPVGFDVGTKSSHVAYVDDHASPQTAHFNEKPEVPSLLLAREGKVLLGAKALASARQDARGLQERLAGRIGTEKSKVEFLDQEVPAEVLFALLIGNLAAEARKQIGYFSHVCYTVPGCYGDAQRKSLRDAFTIASLNAVRPLNCSSAIAIDFLQQKGLLDALAQDQPLHMLVVRCGASSFDATVLRYRQHELETLAVAGDTSLGGISWDDRIAEHVLDHIKRNHGEEVSQDPTAMFLLMQECEAAKAGLNPDGVVPIRFQGQSTRFEGRVKPAFLKRISRDLLARIEQQAQNALAQAGVDWPELDFVLLSGGVSRMPEFRQLFRTLSHNNENCLLGNSTSVANGAALFAQEQMRSTPGSERFVVREQTVFDYIIRSGPDQPSNADCVIKRGTPLPVTAEFTVRMPAAGAASLCFEILEAGGSSDAEPRVVGQCEIRDLSPTLVAGTPIQLRLHVDESGVLSVTGQPTPAGDRYRLNLLRPHCVPAAHLGYWTHWLQSILTGSMPG